MVRGASNINKQVQVCTVQELRSIIMRIEHRDRVDSQKKLGIGILFNIKSLLYIFLCLSITHAYFEKIRHNFDVSVWRRWWSSTPTVELRDCRIVKPDLILSLLVV